MITGRKRVGTQRANEGAKLPRAHFVRAERWFVYVEKSNPFPAYTLRLIIKNKYKENKQ